MDSYDVDVWNEEECDDEMDDEYAYLEARLERSHNIKVKKVAYSFQQKLTKYLTHKKLKNRFVNHRFL
jgi:hypothetical protein